MLTDLQYDDAHYLKLAEVENILILKDGKSIGLLRSFTEEGIDDNPDR